MEISRALALICGGCACLFSVAVISAAPSTQPEASDESRQQIVALPADAAYVAVLGIWGKGNQAEVEALLDRLTQEYPQDSRLAFFRAVCTRSRFEVPEAYPLFGKVVQLAPDSPEGLAARAMMKLDLKTQVDAQFAVLRELITNHPNHLLLLWTMGIASRTYDHNQEGADAYEALLKRVDPGPVLVHQTYANILEELHRSEDALPHRLLAVKLEPASWSYDGLGTTLSNFNDGMRRMRPIKRAPNWLQTLRSTGRTGRGASVPGAMPSKRKNYPTRQTHSSVEDEDPPMDSFDCPSGS